MKILFWNCRGIRKKRARERLKKLNLELNPDIICIVEPKIPPSQISLRTLRSLGLATSILHNNPITSIPNIWIFWKQDDPQPIVVNSSNQHITISHKGAFISFVHASSLYVTRRSLWHDLNSLNLSQQPWAIIGDFNAYRSLDEKKGGLLPQSAAMSDFNGFIDSQELVSPHNTGVNFTWSNKQAGSRRILGKLDRILVTNRWLQLFPSWSYKALSRLCSDHSPLHGFSISIPKPPNSPFKFHKMWASHPEFLPLVEASWSIYISGNPFFVLSQKLKRLKLVLKSWNKSSFGHLDTNIKSGTDSLHMLQMQLDLDPFNEALINEVLNQERHMAG
ncbi:Ribonuclease h domain [Thalictrum thalictroides]|uniref:Ribonuclease h domain n=1 Tax=Thalictrum thalictroides TaxID=46969 RepID=A0A7J6VQY1_THATH|nr:Ribonuclease h domain [Thalictrum thalictroides]